MAAMLEPAVDGRTAGRAAAVVSPDAGSRVVKNAVALGLTRPATWLSTLGLTILLPRYLGDVALGRMNLAFAFADWCGLLASFGIATYLAREVARRPMEASTLVMNAVIVRLVIGVFAGLGAVLVASVIDLAPATRQLVYLLTLHMLLLVLSGVFIGALQGVQKLRWVAAIDAVSKLIQLALVAGVLFAGSGAVAVALAYVVSDMVLLALLFVTVQRAVGLSGPVSMGQCGAIFRGGMPFLIWESALLTYARVDVLILAAFSHDAVLGWYSAAYRIISIPLFVPTVIMTAVFPALSAAAADDEAFSRLVRRAVQVAAITTLPMACGLMVIASAIIRFLDYPAGFANSAWPLTLLAATLPLVGINMIVGSALAARDRQRQWAVAGVIAAVLNLSLNFVAIPYTQEEFGNGAIGAATVTSVTEVWLLIAGLVLIPRSVIDRVTVSVLLRSAGAGVLMMAFVWPVRDASVLLSVPWGALTYAAAVLAFRAASLEDVRSLRRQLRPA